MTKVFFLQFTCKVFKLIININKLKCVFNAVMKQYSVDWIWDKVRKMSNNINANLKLVPKSGNFRVFSFRDFNLRNSILRIQNLYISKSKLQTVVCVSTINDNWICYITFMMNFSIHIQTQNLWVESQAKHQNLRTTKVIFC